MLKTLPRFADDRLIVGFDSCDDACVYRLREDLVAVQTVDFFPPMVDDPHLFGQIAAANALSDIYAMGARPQVAMNLLCYPSCVSAETVAEILRGGYEKVMEAGAVIAGGHTIEDPVPKYGLCVSGFAHPNEVLLNSTAQPGDVLVLTKPLGSGIITTAIKAQMAEPESIAAATATMAQLNRAAAEAMAQVKVHACTDITGFGLLGHASEMAEQSGVSVHIFAQQVPVLPGACELADMGLVPAGAYRNADYLHGQVAVEKGVPLCQSDVLYDPQTSGGLLIALCEEQAQALLPLLQAAQVQAAVIGRAVPQEDVRIRVFEK